jgi:hypothetical protein
VVFLDELDRLSLPGVMSSPSSAKTTNR